ncbi:hypothetical protein I7X12_03085 [Halosimplex litoreum]|uniref:Big-1 domain-containing protein n=1 Tax=Halosimplex litoreum TaxID=1198301 RepID=A0A7T3FZP8_9EURY|nr:carboxypeptidase regulatory-like domain-containing protein [Halosimplex litoreum]QPV63631.1 hypothetical protein I7X12_03085 [Halosimplex litoreum]
MDTLRSVCSPGRTALVLVALAVLASLVSPGAAAAVGTVDSSGPTDLIGGAPATVGAANNSTVSYVEMGSDRARTDAAPTIRQRFEVNRTPSVPGEVTVTYEATLPGDVVELYPTVSRLPVEYEVTSSENFTYDTEQGRWELRSSYGERTTGRLVYTVATNVTASGGYDTVETDDWAFIDGQQLTNGLGYLTFGDDPSIDTTYEAVRSGYGADGRMFLGEHGTSQAAGTNQTVTVVEGADAAPPLSASTTAGYVANVSGKLAIGDRDPDVTAFLLPEPIRPGGRGGGGAFWVGASTSRFAETVAHEYIHTRQAWLDGDRLPEDVDSDLDWFTEGSADYYGGYYAWRAGYLSEAGFRSYLDDETTRYADSVLRDGVDTTQLKNYYKGRRVLGSLDATIRGFGGNATLETVFRRINTVDNASVSYATFREEVVAVTNASVGDSLDRFTGTRDAPSIPSDLSSVYATSTAESTPPVTVGNLSISPATVSANETVDGTVSFEVGEVSGDGNTDTVSVTLPTDVGVVAEGLNASVTDADGNAVAVTGSPELTDADGGSNNRVLFEISPTADLNGTVSVALSLRSPVVDRNASVRVTASVRDSARGTASANTTLTVEPAAPDLLSVSLSPSTVAANSSANVTVTVTDGSGSPVADASVTSAALGVTETTGSEGNATVSVRASAGTYPLTVSAAGYGNATATVTVTEAGLPQGAVYEAGSVAAEFDTNEDGLVGITELGAAAEAYAGGDLSIRGLGAVAEAYAAS